MKLPLSVAKALRELLSAKSIPSSSMKNKAFSKDLVEEGVLRLDVIGRTQGKLRLVSPENLQSYLYNKFQISDLSLYIQVLEKESITGKEGVIAASDSKLRVHRNLKGFIANCHKPINAWMFKKPITLHPHKGFLIYIHDFEQFKVEKSVTILGVENSENLVNLNSALTLFPRKELLFVSRYPQSSDLIKWLKQISNKYLHFGDFDLKGVAIYQDEFKRYLGERATFFVPPNIQEIIRKYGNRKRYDTQLNTSYDFTILEDSVKELIKIIHKERKGLDQQYFL